MSESNGYGVWTNGHEAFLARVRGRVERVIKRVERTSDGISYSVRVSDPDAGHTREEDEDTFTVWYCFVPFQPPKPSPEHGAMMAALEQDRIADEIASRYTSVCDWAGSP